MRTKIFLAGNPANNQVLIDYVEGGGNVYLAGGTGIGGPTDEANRWNTFLNHFGLRFESAGYNGVAGNIAISHAHPIFNNVDHLYQNNGNDTLDIAPLDPRGEVLITQGTHGLYAVYDGIAVPEPATLTLFGTAMLGLLGLRSAAARSRKNYLSKRSFRP